MNAWLGVGYAQRSISSQAPRCPSYGHSPNANQLSPVLYWIGRAIEGVMVAMMIGIVLLVAYSGFLFRYLTAPVFKVDRHLEVRLMKADYIMKRG